jgi:predicted HicB family RNase H-like nuclease
MQIWVANEQLTISAPDGTDKLHIPLDRCDPALIHFLERYAKKFALREEKQSHMRTNYKAQQAKMMAAQWLENNSPSVHSKRPLPTKISLDELFS